MSIANVEQFLAFGFSFAICWGVRNGLGRHQEHIDPANELALRKSEYAFSVIYVRLAFLMQRNMVLSLHR